MKLKFATTLLMGALLVSPLVIAGCKKGEAPAAQVEAINYAVTGEVQGFQAEGLVVILKHDKIEGFMDAMTMGFELKDKALGEGLKKGDKVSGTLTVAGDDIRLTALAKAAK